MVKRSRSTGSNEHVVLSYIVGQLWPGRVGQTEVPHQNCTENKCKADWSQHMDRQDKWDRLRPNQEISWRSFMTRVGQSWVLKSAQASDYESLFVLNAEDIEEYVWKISGSTWCSSPLSHRRSRRKLCISYQLKQKDTKYNRREGLDIITFRKIASKKVEHTYLLRTTNVPGGCIDGEWMWTSWMAGLPAPDWIILESIYFHWGGVRWKITRIKTPNLQESELHPRHPKLKMGYKAILQTRKKITAMNTFYDSSCSHLRLWHTTNACWTLVIHILIALRFSDDQGEKKAASYPGLNTTKAAKLFVARFLPFSNEARENIRLEDMWTRKHILCIGITFFQ